MSEETKKQLKNMSEKVLEAIKTDEVTMHSRLYFLSRTTLWILGVILSFGLTLYLISFAAFIFRGNGLHLLPHLGAGGWFNLFISLPWILLLGVFVVFLLLQILSTHFSFVYKRPLVHTILASIFILVIGGVAIGQTTLHDRAYRFSQEHNVPLAAPMYRDAIRDRGDVHIGTAEGFEGETLLLKNRNGETYMVTISESTRMPRVGITTSSMIMVIGPEDDGKIQAIGIRPFDANKPLFPQRPQQKPGKPVENAPRFR